MYTNSIIIDITMHMQRHTWLSIASEVLKGLTALLEYFTINSQYIADCSIRV